MVWMKDDHVICIIDNALTSTVKLAYQMYVRAFGTSAFEPRLTETDNLEQTRLFVFDGEDLGICQCLIKGTATIDGDGTMAT
jgi:hypothetical protein